MRSEEVNQRTLKKEKLASRVCKLRFPHSLRRSKEGRQERCVAGEEKCGGKKKERKTRGEGTN